MAVKKVVPAVLKRQEGHNALKMDKGKLVKFDPHPPKEILSPHERKAGDPFEVSQGTIKTWRRCRNKYYYAFIELIEPRKPKLPMIRGTMIGKCLDLLAWNRVYPKDQKPWKTALDPYRKEYGRLFDEEKELYGDPIGEVERIVTRYEQIYANDGLRYMTASKTSPDPFELPVRVNIAPGIVFTGHIDKMPVDKHGRIWDMDHKSHKSIPGPEDRFSDLQQVFYQWAAPLSGYPRLSGVIWDYLRTKPPVIPEQLVRGGLSQRKNMDTDFDTYMAELQRLNLDPRPYADFLYSLKQRGHMDFYQRVPLPAPSKELVKNVVDEAIETSKEIKQLGGVSRYRTIDRTCKSCQFYSICQAEYRGLDADFIRKSEYQTQKDPRHIHLFTEED